VKLLGKCQMPSAGILRLLFAHHVDGGVRPKTIGNAVVVALQSWKMGDLNFVPTRITAREGLLRLITL
jgi:hypothetical protein